MISVKIGINEHDMISGELKVSTHQLQNHPKKNLMH